MQKPTTKHNIIKNAAAIELYKLRPPVAPGELLVEYRDFAQYRWFIDLAQYDEKLMLRMAVMLRDNLEKRGRINRRDLFSSLRKMAARIPDKRLMGDELKGVLFEIFERVNISGRHNFSNSSLAGYQQAIDAVLKDMTLSNEAVNTLISNAGKSFRILNRILNYPCAHTTISMWALVNFENDKFRHKRIKLLARVFDDNPHYSFSRDVVEADHDYFNKYDWDKVEEAEFNLMADLDRLRIKTEKREPPQQSCFEFKEESFEIWDDDFKGIPLYPKELKPVTVSVKREEPDATPLHKRLLNKLVYRYYYRSSGLELNAESYLEDVNKYFNRNKLDIYNVVYLYALYHSHLDMRIKTQLLQDFYITTHNTLVINIARKMKNIEFLEWMMENDFEG